METFNTGAFPLTPLKKEAEFSSMVEEEEEEDDDDDDDDESVLNLKLLNVGPS